jgi:CDP-diacylglycerol--serine O-phosphatidyltransferase
MGKKRAIIPNAFTMGNMIMGFFAIIFASRYDADQSNYETIAVAAILIFIGSLFDASDGAIARALKVQSEIGEQLDSLADGITYGIAPGVIAYKAYLYQLPEIGNGIDVGMLVAIIFPVCAIYRLAKFNVSDDDTPGFKGLPSPAAGIIASSVPALWMMESVFFGDMGYKMGLELYIGLFVVTALLMVSNIDYNKLFSDIYKKGRAPFAIALVLVVLLLVFFKMWAVFMVSLIYAVLGILVYFFKKCGFLKV